MTEQITSSEAQAALRAAAVASARIRPAARWMATYVALFGLVFAGITLLLGLTDLIRTRPFVLVVTFFVLEGGILLWARRQRATLTGTGRRVALSFIGMGLLYVAVLVVGVNRFQGEPAHWIPAAVVVAAPMFFGAWREACA